MSAYLGNKKVNVGVYIETDRVVLSAAEYAALPEKDPNTMYLVYDDPLLVEVAKHMGDEDVHVTPEDKERWDNIDLSALDEHIENTDVHVTAEEKASIGKFMPTLLWSNSSSSLSATTIELENLSNYNFFMISYSMAGGNPSFTVVTPSTHKTVTLKSDTGNNYTRTLTFSDTGIKITSATYSGDGSVSNGNLVPLYIWGF